MRLIDADKAKEVLTNLLYETALNNSGGASLMCEDIAENRLETWFGLVPTVDAVPLEDYKSMERTVNKLTKALVDAEPVRHGRWVIEPNATVMHCDVCGWAFEYYGGLEEEWNYCLHCGAKMDEVENG